MITTNNLAPTQKHEIYCEYFGKSNANDVGLIPKLMKHPKCGIPMAPVNCVNLCFVSHTTKSNKQKKKKVAKLRNAKKKKKKYQTHTSKKDRKK